jgi:hypothetical protein
LNVERQCFAKAIHGAANIERPRPTSVPAILRLWLTESVTSFLRLRIITRTDGFPSAARDSFWMDLAEGLAARNLSLQGDSRYPNNDWTFPEILPQ